MPPWVSSTLDVLQLVVNIGALTVGAVIWRLYTGNMKAALTAKSSEIASVEKNRDMWKDKALELEKRSPEFMERILRERIETREGEIARLAEDKDRNVESLTLLQREKVNLESDLFRTRGFRLMLALEEEDIEETEDTEETENTEGPEPAASLIPEGDEVRVVLLGGVAVDSGQLMVTDPCYVDQQWQHLLANDGGGGDETSSEEPSHRVLADQANGDDRALPPYSYEGACETTLSNGYGELAFEMGHAGAGVVFATAWGDGMYPIYGELHDGRIIRAYINVA